MNWANVLLVSVVAAMLSTAFLRFWLFKRYQAGKIGGRRAGWIYAAVAGAPYLVLFSFIAIQDPGSIWVLLLIGLLIYGVTIVPWVATFRYPEDQQRRHHPGDDS